MGVNNMKVMVEKRKINKRGREKGRFKRIGQSGKIRNEGRERREEGKEKRGKIERRGLVR